MYIKVEKQDDGKFIIWKEKLGVPYKTSQIINISNANIVTFEKRNKENTGILWIAYTDNRITIDDVSIEEWSIIQDSLIEEGITIFDLTKFRNENKAKLDNRSDQFNPNNKKHGNK